MFLSVLSSATPPHILDVFSCSFSEMPNSALAGVARQEKVGPRSHRRFFFIRFSVVSTAVGITYRSWERERERKRRTCKGIHERNRESAMKTCEETHELCSIMIQRV